MNTTMEPRIQYARTSDGVNIAYAHAGEGREVLVVPFMFQTHITEAWDFPDYWLRALTERFHVTWYDCRGSGLSQRDAQDLSVDAMLRDADAVIAGAGLERFALLASWDGTPVAIRYAAEHPELVSHLVLGDAWAKYSDFLGTAAIGAETALRRQDWNVYTETMGKVLADFKDPELARKYAELMRAAVNPDVYWTGVDAMMQWDVSAFLHRIRVPALVLHSKGNNFLTVESAQRIASEIPNALLQLVDSALYPGLAEVVADLMGDGAVKGEPSPTAASAFRTVLFTDLVGHTEMMSRLGDERGRDVLREHETITRNVLKHHGGTEVKTMGDGFMASFGSVTKAVDCAIALERAFAERNEPEAEPLLVRVGLNAGEPIEEEGDLFGSTVILASRIAAKADGGEILVADTVRGLCSGKGFLFSDRGEFVAKGFEEPVRVYEVRWQKDLQQFEVKPA